MGFHFGWCAVAGKVWGVFRGSFGLCWFQDTSASFFGDRGVACSAAGNSRSERVFCGTPVTLIHAELFLHDVGHSAVYNCDVACATSEYKTAFETHWNATELFLPSISPEMWTFAVCTRVCCLPVSVCLSVHADWARSIFQFVAFRVLSRILCAPQPSGFFRNGYWLDAQLPLTNYIFVKHGDTNLGLLGLLEGGASRAQSPSCTRMCFSSAFCFMSPSQTAACSSPGGPWTCCALSRTCALIQVVFQRAHRSTPKSLSLYVRCESDPACADSLAKCTHLNVVAELNIQTRAADHGVSTFPQTERRNSRQ